MSEHQRSSPRPADGEQDSHWRNFRRKRQNACVAEHTSRTHGKDHKTDPSQSFAFTRESADRAVCLLEIDLRPQIGPRVKKTKLLEPSTSKSCPLEPTDLHLVDVVLKLGAIVAEERTVL